ncbi:MAG: carbohydrate ABC transporter permease [Candidatus Gallimonas sp.]
MRRREYDGYTPWEKFKSKVGWRCYGLRQKIPSHGRKREKSMSAMKRGKAVFCAAVLIIPLLQFFLFYVCVNFNSLLLAFQKIDAEGNRFFCGFDNFSTLFTMFRTDSVFGYALKNSLIAYLFVTVLATPLSLLFAFYVYKQALFGRFFKIMLFLPSVLSSIVMVMMYTYFVDLGVPMIAEKVFGAHIAGLFSNNDTKFATVLFYNVYIGFGSSILMYLSAMNSINSSLVEAAQLEGANYAQEFFYLTFPQIYPTFVTFFIVGIAGIFTNQLNLFSFMGTDSPLPQMQTFGYYMYQQTVAGTANYPRLAALGLMITVVVAPVTLLAKYLLEKYGPSAEEKN